MKDGILNEAKFQTLDFNPFRSPIRHLDLVLCPVSEPRFWRCLTLFGVHICMRSRGV
jgi:hypothetical protein